jgi:hypothetical protein
MHPMGVTDRRRLYLAGTLAPLYAALFFIIHSAFFAREPRLLGAAVTFDLTITAALAGWWITRSRRTAVYVLGLGFLLARLFLPPNAREGLLVLRVLWAGAELVVMAAALSQVRSIAARYRAARSSGPVEALRQALEPAIGAFPARLFATELSIISYAVTGWRRATPSENARTFSLYRQEGTVAAVFVFLIAVESTILHVIVATHSPLWAWLLTASSVWGALWIIGDAQAVRLSPLTITADTLVVPLGVRWRVEIPLHAIAAVGTVTDRAPQGPHTLRAARAWDVAIVTHQLVEARGLFGRRKRIDTLLLPSSRPDELIAALTRTPPA